MNIAAIVIDTNPDPKDVVVGTQVVGQRPNESSHVEGKIIEINDEDGKMAYRIDFWDGVGNWNTLEQIRVLTTTKPGGLSIVDANDSAAVVPDVVPDPASLTVDTWVFNINNIRILMTRKPKVPEGVLDVGTVVWAHTSKIRYYKGFVSYKGTKLHVDLYDGDKFLYEMKDASHRVIPDVPPKAADIKPGTRVIANYKNRPRYFSSTVMEIDASDPSEPKYHLKFDDGDEILDSL
ncbi:hypothetical protein OS493_034406 [Desmophyllum pertusum]|uniref:Uncharacterized protein n=1 Tax=Desmophyllum pertusum TaxID=174260 RepID=A0A9W9ZW79_9CNID|nr:hypothetical protein OS493_034406 [Desmophyllum pertusum]